MEMTIKRGAAGRGPSAYCRFWRRWGEFGTAKDDGHGSYDEDEGYGEEIDPFADDDGGDDEGLKGHVGSCQAFCPCPRLQRKTGNLPPQGLLLCAP